MRKTRRDCSADNRDQVDAERIAGLPAACPRRSRLRRRASAGVEARVFIQVADQPQQRLDGARPDPAQAQPEEYDAVTTRLHPPGQVLQQVSRGAGRGVRVPESRRGPGRAACRGSKSLPGARGGTVGGIGAGARRTSVTATVRSARPRGVSRPAGVRSRARSSAGGSRRGRNPRKSRGRPGSSLRRGYSRPAGLLERRDGRGVAERCGRVNGGADSSARATAARWPSVLLRDMPYTRGEHAGRKTAAARSRAAPSVAVWPSISPPAAGEFPGRGTTARRRSRALRSGDAALIHGNAEVVADAAADGAGDVVDGVGHGHNRSREHLYSAGPSLSL